MTDTPGHPTQNLSEQYHSTLLFDWDQGELSKPLRDTDLHIWCASLKGSQEVLSHFLSLLSPEEKARAKRFYFERDSNRYVFGRGILRTLLGGYLGMEASRVEFIYGPQGKPAIQKVFKNRVLQFNLSHSNDQAIYVFGWDNLIGIDLEQIRPMQDADDFANQFFSARETAFIKSLPDDKKWDAFFKIWTCKESFLKANGSGLTIPIDQVEISLQTEGSAVLSFTGSEKEQVVPWHLETFNPIPGYQAAMAVEGHEGQIVI